MKTTGKTEPQYPKFTVYYHPRGPNQSEESYARGRRYAEERARAQGVYLHCFQQMMTVYEAYRGCPLRRCRRRQRCSGRRPEHGPLQGLAIFIPPCVPFEEEVFEPLRQQLSRLIGEVLQDAERARGGGTKDGEDI